MKVLPFRHSSDNLTFYQGLSVRLSILFLGRSCSFVTSQEMRYNGADGLGFEAGNTKLDPAVLNGKVQTPGDLTRFFFILTALQELLEGCRASSTEDHGVSFWAQTGRIDVLLRNGTPQSFRKKLGMDMTKGECQSMSAIHKVLPEFVLSPIACGTQGRLPG